MKTETEIWNQLFVEDLLKGAAPMLTILFIQSVNNAFVFYTTLAGSLLSR